MAIEPDHLDNLVVAEAKVSSTGLSVSAKSRFVAAADRLCGNIVDAVNIPIEKHNKKARVSMEAEVADLKATLKDFLKNHKEQYPQIERAVTNENSAIVRKQANRDEVVKIAKETLDQQIDDVSETSTQESLDPDWLNDFESFAERASSEEMRILFGRILAGEVLSPGAYSKTTIRTVWELDRKNAVIFQKLAKDRVLGFIPFEKRVDDFEEILNLETTGLVIFSGGTLSVSVESENEHIVELIGETLVCKLHLIENRTKLEVPTIQLSQQGIEIAPLVETIEIEGIRKLARIVKDQYEKIEIFRIISKTLNQTRYQSIPVEVIMSPNSLNKTA
jgi:hypothetical protein